MVIKWINNKHAILCITLQALAEQIKTNIHQFKKITFIHVYREMDTLEYSLGLLLDPGLLHLKEFKDGNYIEYTMDLERPSYFIGCLLWT